MRPLRAPTGAAVLDVSNIATPIDLGNVRLAAERNALAAVVDDQHVILRRMVEEIAWARRIINRGVDLMPLEQLSQWEGVRAWLEGVDSDISENTERTDTK